MEPFLYEIRPYACNVFGAMAVLAAPVPFGRVCGLVLVLAGLYILKLRRAYRATA